MEHENPSEQKGILQTHELYKYILETNVFPREPEPVKELKDLTASHPWAKKGTAPDSGQAISFLLKTIGAKKTIEVGVFTGYSLLLTALSIPDDGKIVAIDVNREFYEIGRPFIQKAKVEHKIDFIESLALPVLDNLLKNSDNEGSFDFAYVDADKENNINYHERILKLLKINGIVVYDNTLWRGTVAKPEDMVPEELKAGRINAIAFNKALVADPRIDIFTVPLGDGITICRRLS